MQEATYEAMQEAMQSNMLVCADNLAFLPRLAAESVDLAYLDPPFNTGRHFVGRKGSLAADAVFHDTPAHFAVDPKVAAHLAENFAALTAWLKGMAAVSAPSLIAYLNFMAPRVVALHRVLKPTGSLFLHCDERTAHGLRGLLDAVFGHDQFRNHVIWNYHAGGASRRWYARRHDDLLFYSKSSAYQFRVQREPYAPRTAIARKNIAKFHPDGRMLTDVWQISRLGNNDKAERVGYPTQKPLALLHRIIRGSSEEGAVVLDPFCGSGTTLLAAEQLGRRWIGCDSAPEAIAVVEARLRQQCPDTPYTTAPPPGA
ncbi:MAG: site-specific DNA-methyltransferase [Alphaproteobacteria bacterium]|nr:site-specific DNA-methyltransferase [Alphaproteobacteria bacterium]